MKEKLTPKDIEKIQAEIDHREAGASSTNSGCSTRSQSPGRFK